MAGTQEPDSVSTKTQRIAEGLRSTSEEPDRLIAHVRIYGGPGGQPLGLPDY